MVTSAIVLPFMRGVKGQREPEVSLRGVLTSQLFRKRRTRGRSQWRAGSREKGRQSRWKEQMRTDYDMEKSQSRNINKWPDLA